MRLMLHARKLGATDLDALRGLYMFESEPQVKRYLDNFVMLRDLGFPEDRIDKALLSADNDQERALENLMV